MEVNPPLAGGRGVGRQGLGQIGEVFDAAVGVTDAGLVQVARLGKGLEFGAGRRGVGGRQRFKVHRDRRRKLHLADAKPRVAVGADGLFLGLKHDGAVAHVVAHAEVGPHAQVVGGAQEVSLKKVDHVGAGLQQAAGLGFDIQVDQVAGVQLGAGQVVDQARELFGRGRGKGRVQRQPAAHVARPAQGQGADRAFGALGQQLGQQGDEIAGVRGAVGVGPVGLVHGVFHHRLVEIAVRKTIEGVGQQPAFLQPVFELGRSARGDRFAGGVGAEPQAHAHRGIGADLLLDRNRVAIKVCFDLGQRGSRVHVGAVAQDG